MEREVADYYANSQVVDYFFATNKAGKSTSPLIAGAATFNEEKCALDLHFINFKYRKSYIKSVLGSAKVDQVAFELALGARQQTIESLYPALIDNAHNTDSDVKARMHTLRASRLGFVRLELSQVDQII